MNILYTFNDKFVPQAAAGICSICENNKGADSIHFYLFTHQLSDQNKQKLTEFVHSYRREVTFVELLDLSSYFDFEFDTLGWNPVILARLLMDKLLPLEVERIIYLDGDTIVRGSLEELWATDMGQCAVGGCAEPTVDKARKAQLGMSEYPYINSGVLLVDLKIWRENDLGKRIIDFYQAGGGRLFAPDQDAINGALKGEIFLLHPKYNFSNTFLFYPYRTLKKLMDGRNYITETACREAKENPVIVHYLGEERPWRNKNTHKYRGDFLHYLHKTPWRDMPMEDGWELYFLCWRIFNGVMKVTPMLRYKIINSLIPAFMAHRSKQLKKNHEK